MNPLIPSYVIQSLSDPDQDGDIADIFENLEKHEECRLFTAKRTWEDWCQYIGDAIQKKIHSHVEARREHRCRNGNKSRPQASGVSVNLSVDPLRKDMVEREREESTLSTIDKLLGNSCGSSREARSRETLDPSLWERARYHSTQDGLVARSLDIQETSGLRKRYLPDRAQSGCDPIRGRRHVRLHPSYNRNPLTL
jgi:hypothetical protein